MKQRSLSVSCLALVLTLACVAPYGYVLFQSFFRDGGLTLWGYFQVFLNETQYLARFWTSLGLTSLIALAQLLVSLLAGFGFAKCNFPGKKAIFFVLMILMILPLQVTLVPNYLMLDQLGLLDTYYALVLPAIFVPLGTFIMTRSFQSVPKEVVEAARLDGCTTLGGDLPHHRAHEQKRPGVYPAPLLPGRVEHGGAAHGVPQGLFHVPYLGGTRRHAAHRGGGADGLLHSGGATAAVPLRLLQPGAGGGHRAGR